MQKLFFGCVEIVAGSWPPSCKVGNMQLAAKTNSMSDKRSD